MRFNREKMLENIDAASAPIGPIMPYEVTAKEMALRWRCSRETASRHLKESTRSEDNPQGIYETREAKVDTRRVANVWWIPEWKEAWEAGQREMETEVM